MTEPLPYGGFIWVENVDDTDFYTISDDGDFSYFVEVDLKYPETLHDSHKDLPFCAEHMAPPSSKQYKLMTTLHDKQCYVLHYRALKQALKHGLVLVKIHRAIQFKQIPWLKNISTYTAQKGRKPKMSLKKCFSNFLTTLFMSRRWKTRGNALA